jgi:integrase
VLMAKRRLFRKRLGKHGASVVIFERRAEGSLYLGFYDAGGVLRARSLGHTDPDRAEQQAYELLARGEHGDENRSVQLGELAQLYREEAAPEQSERVRAQKETHLQSWVNYLGPGFDMRRFDLAHWQGYIRARMAGAIDAQGLPVDGERRPVGATIVETACKVLRQACKLGTQKRVAPGRFLLTADPTRGLKLPRNPNVKRPRYTDDEYRALLAVAGDVNDYLLALLVLAHDTGRRISAITSLTWSDWLPDEGTHGTLRWRAATDKQRRDWVTPVTQGVRDVIEAHRRRFPGVGDAFMFPDPGKPRRPIYRQVVRDWLMECEGAANVEHIERRGWHGFRRQFATETKHLPVRDVMELGGWTNSLTVEQAYQSADMDTMLEVLEGRRRLRGTR